MFMSKNTDCHQPLIVRSFDESFKRAMVCGSMMTRMGERRGPCANAVKQLHSFRDDFAALFPLLYGVVFEQCTCEDEGQHVYKTRQMTGNNATKPEIASPSFVALHTKLHKDI